MATCAISLPSTAQVAGWLIPAGRVAYGIGNRMPIRETRALLSAALDGSLNAVDFRTDENFGFEVPSLCRR